MRVFKRYALVILFIGVSISLVSGLVYVAGLLGIERGDPRLLATQILVTARPPLPGTPVARFAQIDPAIVPYLDNRQPSYGVIPLDALGKDIQPVGAYLPSHIVAELPTETPTPTLSPTDTPVPTTAVPPTAIPPAAVPSTSIPEPPVSIVVVPTAVPPPIVEAPIPEVQAVAQPSEPPPAPATEVVSENPTSAPPPTAQVANFDCAPAGLPTSGVLTQRFHQFHIGIDIGVPVGTPLRATQSGTVIEAGWNDIGYGNVVAIKNGAFSTYYGHQTSVNVSMGQFVHQGDIIGYSGSTGNSNGPHVHYETRINDVPVDPLTFESRGYPTC